MLVRRYPNPSRIHSSVDIQADNQIVSVRDGCVHRQREINPQIRVLHESFATMAYRCNLHQSRGGTYESDFLSEKMLDTMHPY